MIIIMIIIANKKKTMKYVTLRNGVANPITDRKQLYCINNYEWITHIDLHDSNGLKTSDINFAIDFNERTPIAINLQITGSRKSTIGGLYEQYIACSHLYNSGTFNYCGIITSNRDNNLTIKKGIILHNDTIAESVINPKYNDIINCNILIENIKETYKIYSDNKYIGETTDYRIFHIFDSSKLYNHDFKIGEACKCTDIVLKYKFHK